MTELPAWTMEDLSTQINALLNNPVISGLVISMIALSVGGMILDFVKRVTRSR